MDNDEDTVTVSRAKYDTIMNENEIMQNEIARLQNLLKSRKRIYIIWMVDNDEKG